MYLIPLNSAPNQTFTCIIPVNGENIRFTFFLSYNSVAKYWQLTLTKTLTQEVMVSCLPILSSSFDFRDIFNQLGYKNIGKCMIFNKNNDFESMPNDENLGTDYLMLWEDNDE